MQDIQIEERDYYAILGISRNASVEEIKQKYRILSRQFHPDKQSPDLQIYANEYFHRIDRAYQVLSDEKKRKLYDEYGEKAVFLLENNEELVKRDTSIDTIEDLIHTIYQRELESKAGQSGSYTMTVDISSLLHAPPPPQPTPSFMMSAPQPALGPHIDSIQIVQSIQTRLNASNVLSLTGTATAQGGKGYGVSVITLQHAISADQALTLTTLCGARNRVIVEVVQSLTKTVQGGVSIGYGNEGIETGIKIAKQFNDDLLGVVDMNLSEAVECNLSTEYTHNDMKIHGSLFVGQDVGGKVSILKIMDKEKDYRMKGTLQISASDLSIETMIGKVLSSLSKVNLNVQTGLKGVLLKLKYQRGNMNFILPIQLSHFAFDIPAIMIGYSISALACLTEWIWTRTEKGKVAEKKREEEKKKQAFIHEHERLAAVSQQKMMKSYADRIRKQEEDKKGLVILNAVYGKASCLAIPSKVEAMEGAINVTTAIQFLVKDSKLKLYAGSKREYMGFWNPADKMDDEKVRLYVRYAYGEHVYEIEVDDLEPLYLPAFRATMLGKETLVN